MGSSSKSSSSSASTEYSDSYNQILTSNLSGAQGVQLAATGNSGQQSNNNLEYSYDSGNTSTNLNYSLGANSSAGTGSPGNDATGSASAPSILSGVSIPEIITYIIAGVVLVYILKAIHAPGGGS